MPKVFARLYLLLFVALLSWRTTLFSVTRTWSNTGGAANWNNNANWGDLSFPNGADDVANLTNSIASNSTITLNTVIAVAQINLDSNFNYLIQGGAGNFNDIPATPAQIEINITNVNGNGNHEISALYNYGKPFVITHNSTGTFTMSNTITSGLNPLYTLTKEGTGTTIFAGTNANNYGAATIVNAGTLVLNKTGVRAIPFATLTINNPGTVVRLDQANQIDNAVSVIVNDGTFNLNNNADAITALTVNGGSVTPGGATLTLLTTGTALSMQAATISSPGTVSLTGASGGGIVFNGASGTATIASALNLGSVSRDLNIADGSAGVDMSISGSISATGGLSKSGAGVLQFSGSNAYTGTTTVSAGTLQGGATNTFSANSAHAVNATLDLGGFNQSIGALSGSGSVTLGSNTLTTNVGSGSTYSGTITGVGGSLTKNGTAALILSSAGGNTYSGTTTVSAGTLQGGATNAFSPNSAHVVNATLDLGGFSQSIGALSGSGSVVLGSNTLTTAVGSGSTYSGTITGVGGSLTKNGAAALILSSAGGNTYSGTTTVSAGTLQGAATNAFSPNSAHVVNATLDLGGFSQSIGALSGSGSVTLGSNTLTTNVGSGSTYSGTITGVGGSLTKNGAAALILSSAGGNTYSGTTTVSAGTLQGGATNAFSPNSAHVVNATLDLGGFSQSIGALSGSGSVTLGSNTLTTNVGSGATYSGTITGVGGSLTKNGAAALILSSAGGNTYSGTTTVSAGTLQGGATNAFSASSAHVVNATLDLGGFNQSIGALSGSGSVTLGNNTLTTNVGSGSTYSGTITGVGGSLTKNGAAALILSSAGGNTYSGTTTVSAGTLQGGATNAFSPNSAHVVDATLALGGFNQSIGALSGFGSVTLGGNNLSTNVSSDSLFSGTLAGLGGSLTKNGAARLTLSGANSYTGGTTVSAGILQGTTTSLQGDISNSAAVVFDQTTTGTYAGNMSGAGTVTKQNSGTVAFSGTNNYSGVTTITAGTLQGGAINALSANSAHVVNATLDLGGFSQSIGALSGSGAVTLGSNTLTTNVGSGATYSGTITGVGGSLTKNGAAALILSSSGGNTYSGTTTVSAGTLQGGAANAFSANSAHVVDATLDLGGFSQSIGALSGSGSVTLGSNTLTTNVGSGSTYSGTITGVGGSLTKNGAAALILSSAGGNTYSGTTTVSAGTLQGGAANAFSANSAHVVDATLDLGGFNQSIGALSGSGSVTLGSSTLTTNVGTLSTYSGTITGVGGSLTKNGAATLTLSSAGGNTYSGTTTVSGGSLQGGAVNAFAPTSTHIVDATLDLNNFNQTIGLLSSSAGTGTVSLGNATLTFGTASNASYDGVISGTGGALSKQGAGIATLTGSAANTYTGLTTVAAGTLALTKSGGVAAAPGDVLINGTGTLSATGAQFGAATNVTLNSGTAAFSGAPIVPSFTYLTGSTAGLTQITLTSSSTALTMANTTLSANTILTGGGGIGGTISRNTAGVGSSTINALLFQLGGGSYIFDTLDGTILVNSVISESALSSIVKSGTNLLRLGAANTYTGTTTINSGTIRSDINNALPTTTDLTVGASGTFDLNSNAQAVALLNGSGGVLLGSGVFTVGATGSSTFSGAISDSGAGGSLVKQNAGTLILTGLNAYTGGTTVSGGILQGTVADGGTTSGLQGDILNNAAVVFDQPLANSPGTYAGNMSGSGTLTKQNGGIVSLTGTNSYSGATSVTAGTLQGGVANTFSSSSDVTVGASGTLDLNSNNQTIALLAGSGSVTLGSATLTTGTSGSSTFFGTISGVGGSLTKQNAGTLILTGANSYSGGTTISGGVLQGSATAVQGNITNNASLVFDQATTETYAGTLTGNGSLIKQNSGDLIISGASPAFTGTTSVSGGRLSVNGSLASSSMTVGASATLGGTGTITSPLTVNGTLAPGNSIGVITINGDVVQAAGSTLEIEISPVAADRVDVNGTYTIQPGARLLIIPEAGIYPESFTYIVVNAPPSSLFGTFSTVETTLPTFVVTVAYNSGAGDVLLTNITTLPFASVISGSNNAEAVASCLDTLTATPDSDLESVIAELRMIPTIEGLALALNQMQPSQFTALALAQENATLYVNDNIFQRLIQNAQICPRPCKQAPLPKKVAPKAPQKKRPFFARTKPTTPPSVVPIEEVVECPVEKSRAFWISPFGAFSHQSNKNEQPGYDTGTTGILAGLDFNPSKTWTFGGALGYSYNHLKWEHGQGSSNMQNGYATLYAAATGKYAYLFGSAIGSYNHYNTTRRIIFGDGSLIDIDRHAKGSHHGWQGSGHLQSGLFFGKKLQLSPFARADYIYVKEASFNEHGAESLNLHVESKNSNLLQAEIGLELSRCFAVSKNKVSPSIGLSAIREWRFAGKHYKSSFENGSCVMHTTGMNPDRTLFSGTLGLTILLPDENRTFSLDYKGKWGDSFHDNRLLAQFLLRF